MVPRAASGVVGATVFDLLQVMAQTLKDLPGVANCEVFASSSSAKCTTS